MRFVKSSREQFRQCFGLSWFPFAKITLKAGSANGGFTPYDKQDWETYTMPPNESGWPSVGSRPARRKSCAPVLRHCTVLAGTHRRFVDFLLLLDPYISTNNRTFFRCPAEKGKGFNFEWVALGGAANGISTNQLLFPCSYF